jgi:hypothetical protein
MRTTLNIDEKLLEEVLCETGEKDKGRAVNAALAEFIRRRRLEDLRALRGTIDIEDNLDELERLELEKMRKSE